MPKAATKTVSAAGGRTAVATARGENNGKRRQLVDTEIYAVATQLFSENGYASTSLQDIADAMGLSRPALYHYVRNKEDILANLVEEFTISRAHEHAEIISDDTLNAIQKLGHMVTSTVRAVAEHPERFRLLIRCENELPEEMLKKYTAAKRAVRDAFVTVIKEGVKSGQLRPVDPQQSAFALIGMCTWVAWWFSPSKVGDIGTTVQAITDLALHAVIADKTSNSAPCQPITSIQEIRRHLDNLETSLR